MKGFGLVKKEKSKKQPINFDLEQAAKLYNALRAANRFYGANSVKVQSREFKNLRKDFSKDQIATVLKWFIAHIKDQYVPQVLSAKDFRRKFKAIILSMKRDGVWPDKIVVTDEARKIKQRANLQWPAGEERQELEFIQVCCNNYRAIEDKVKALATHLRAEATAKQKSSKRISSLDEQDARLLERVQAHMPARCDFVRWWLEETNRTAHKWRGWSGRLMDWVLTEHHEKVQYRLHCLISDYTGSPTAHSTFDKLMKEHK